MKRHIGPSDMECKLGVWNIHLCWIGEKNTEIDEIYTKLLQSILELQIIYLNFWHLIWKFIDKNIDYFIDQKTNMIANNMLILEIKPNHTQS